MQEMFNHAYRLATKRLFLLDYDGTLAGFMPTPPQAVPSAHLLAILARLANDPLNTVVITSGRPHETLDAWLGNLPLSFAAEHGFMIKQAGGNWQATMHTSTAWKPEIRTIMEQSAKRLTGVIVEEKDNALAWHSRAVGNTVGASAEQRTMLALLQPLAEHWKLRIIDGSCVIEVQPVGVDKGTAALHWLDQGGWDFVLAAGDDTTDEDLFAAMPESAFTIKVQPGESIAKLRAATPQTMLDLLDALPA